MHATHISSLHKRLLSTSRPVIHSFSHLHEIPIDTCATVHYSSEDSAHPIDYMFDGNAVTGSTQWRSARPNTTEVIVLEFDEPQHISGLVYEVEECSWERTQELRLEFSCDSGSRGGQLLAAARVGWRAVEIERF